MAFLYIILILISLSFSINAVMIVLIVKLQKAILELHEQSAMFRFNLERERYLRAKGDLMR